MFDSAWYLETYPDVPKAGSDPLEHYLRHGAKELRDPGPLFDATSYARQHAGDRRALGNPLLHYIENGGTREKLIEQTRCEIRESGLFDPAWYVETHPDVAHFGRDPLLYYIENGGTRQKLIEQTRRAIAESGLFDPDWYLEIYPDVAKAGLDPIDHYLSSGAKELRDPCPAFDAKAYIRENGYDQIASRNPLLHLIRNQGSYQTIVNVRRRTASLAAEVVGDLVGIEPDLAGLMQSLNQFRLPIVDGIRRDKASEAWLRLFASLDQSYDRIIFVPWLIRDGADLVAVYAAKACVEKFGEGSVLLLVTDSNRMEARDWLPKSTHLRVISDYGPELTFDDRVEIVCWLIQALKPKSVLNVNSRACWEVFMTSGAALSTFTDLHAALFGHDYNDENEPVGYAATHFRVTLRYLKGVYSDNRIFLKKLVEDFGVNSSELKKLRTIYQPTFSSKLSMPVDSFPGNPFRVLWASRLCRSKNTRLLIQIAQKGIDFAFEVFGSGEPDYNIRFAAEAASVDNLVWHGGYSCFTEIPTAQFGAFLYTTLWDGLPNVLISAAKAGLPIVASNRGGVGELVDSETGWLIDDFDNPEAHIVALDAIRRSPDEARRRTTALQMRLKQRHSWESYMTSMSATPSFLA